MTTPHNRLWKILPLCTVAALWSLPVSLASDDGRSSPDDVAAARPPRGDKDAADEKKDGEDKPDFPKWEEYGKDHKEVLGAEGSSGFFPLYYKEKGDQLLCQVPQKMLGKNFLIASSIAGGPGVAGWMWGDRVVQWHEMDKKLVLIEPDLRYKRGGKDDTVADVIDRTYTDRIVLSTPIVSKKGPDPVIDLNDVFKKDFANAGRAFGGQMDATLSRWSKYKCFPKNDEIAVDAAFMSAPQQGGTRARVHFSIVELPENNGYQAREADPRVGYFLTAVKDWTTAHDQDTIFKRLVHRWDLRKAEPDKDLSDAHPDYQIVYYIEKTVPVKYRRYVREGILAWNKAYEKAGFRNAVRVEQQTDLVHADKDPEDVRYSFFRWIVSGRAFAMGPSLANPLTGQILDADIIFDDSMARSWEMQYARYSGTGLAAHDDPRLREFLDRHPEWEYRPLEQRLLPESARFGGVDLSLSPEIAERLADQHGYCTLGEGMAHAMAFGMAYLKATGGTASGEEFVGQMIKYVTAHEVGHTLGLRHNFKASSWKSIEELLNAKDPDEALSASVMDYNTPLLNPNKDKQGLYVTQSVGPYDEWAIEYGYKPFHKGGDCKSEQEMLAAIATRCADPCLVYATDEDTTFLSPDPLTNRWDNASDPLAYARHRMDMVRMLQKDITDWAVDEGESFSKLRRTFDMLMFEYGRSAGFAGRYIGGQYISRDHKGDPNARSPIVIVDAKKQREALDFLTDTILSDRDFQFDPTLLNRLAAGRWMHWESDDSDSQLDYPIHDRIAGIQSGALFYLLNPFTLNRIYDAEVKVDTTSEAITVPELIGRIQSAVWSELDGKVSSKKHTARQPFVSSIRRGLQRQELQMMLNIVLSRPGSMMPADITAVVSLELRNLSGKIGTILDSEGAARLDDFTRAHLDEAKSRIDRALAAKYQL
jgi:hypothetical protein